MHMTVFIRRSYLVIITQLLFLGSFFAQVTIGSEESPMKSSILQLKERDSSISDLSNSNKGFAYPRVALKKISELYPMYELNYPGISDINKEKKLNTGLVVYNITENHSPTEELDFFIPGLYIWNGSQWLLFESSNVVEPGINDLLCGSASLSPASYTKDIPYKGILTIPYTGGNGGFYNSLPSTNVNGLTFSLQSGKLAQGNGQIQYLVEGTPQVSSPTTTNVPINFLKKSCNVMVGNVQEIKTINFARTVAENFTANNLSSQTYTALGNIEVRIAESRISLATWSNFLEYKVKRPTNITVLYTKSGNSVGYMVTGRKAASSTSSWYKVKTGATYGDDALVFDSSATAGPNGSKDDFNAANRDVVQAVFMLHNTKEIYRVTLNSNEAIPANGSIPAVPPTVTIFLEKLD